MAETTALDERLDQANRSVEKNLYGFNMEDYNSNLEKINDLALKSLEVLNAYKITSQNPDLIEFIDREFYNNKGSFKNRHGINAAGGDKNGKAKNYENSLMGDLESGRLDLIGDDADSVSRQARFKSIDSVCLLLPQLNRIAHIYKDAIMSPNSFSDLKETDGLTFDVEGGGNDKVATFKVLDKLLALNKEYKVSSEVMPKAISDLVKYGDGYICTLDYAKEVDKLLAMNDSPGLGSEGHTIAQAGTLDNSSNFTIGTEGAKSLNNIYKSIVKEEWENFKSANPDTKAVEPKPKDLTTEEWESAIDDFLKVEYHTDMMSMFPEEKEIMLELRDMGALKAIHNPNVFASEVAGTGDPLEEDEGDEDLDNKDDKKLSKAEKERREKQAEQEKKEKEKEERDRKDRESLKPPKQTAERQYMSGGNGKYSIDEIVNKEKLKKKKYTIQGSILKVLDPKKVIVVEVGGKELGFYFLSADFDDGRVDALDYNPQGCPACDLTYTSDRMYSFITHMSNSQVNKETRGQILADLCLKRLSKKLDKRFIAKNKEFKDFIFTLLRTKKRLGKVNITFIPAKDMIHLKRGTGTYGESIFDSVLYFAKLYILSLLSALMQQIIMGKDKQIFYVDTGLDEDSEGAIQKFIHDFRTKEITVDDFSDVTNIMNRVTKSNSMFIPVVDGKKAVEFDTYQGQPAEFNNDFLQDLLKSIIAGTGIPTSWLDSGMSDIDFATQLVQQNGNVKRTVSAYQRIVNQGVTQLFRNLIEQDKGDISELGIDFVIHYPEPITLDTKAAEESITRAQGIADFICNTLLGENPSENDLPAKEFMKRELLKKYSSGIDWEEAQKILDKARAEAQEARLTDEINDMKNRDNRGITYGKSKGTQYQNGDMDAEENPEEDQQQQQNPFGGMNQQGQQPQNPQGQEPKEPKEPEQNEDQDLL